MGYDTHNYISRREQEVALPKESLTVKLTCLTKEHGIVVKEWTGTQLPDVFVVPVVLPEHERSKFDPRKDWDAWTNTQSLDPTIGEIYCLRFAGTLYIQGDLRFMRKKQTASEVIQKQSDHAPGKVSGIAFHYEFSHSNPFGGVKIGYL